MSRRKGYAEAEHEAFVRRKKREHRKQTLIAVAVIAMFGSLVTMIYIGLWMWANGYMGV